MASKEIYPALTRAALAARAYLEGLSEHRVLPDKESLKRVATFNPDLPAIGTSDEEIVATLMELANDGVTATAGPRFFGYVTGGALPSTVAASWLAAAWDQVASDPRQSPLAYQLEVVTSQWLLNLLRLPETCTVNYVTGSTMAAFVGLASAREATLARQGWDVQKQGLVGAPPIRLVLSDDAHPSIFKVLGMLGLGRETALRVPVDREGRMRTADLPEFDDNTIVCAQVGNVNSGSFDSLTEITKRAKAAGAWVHIDGAFGLLAAASPRWNDLLSAHDQADSWNVDGHKWLNTPYDCGIAICRHPNVVAKTFAYRASYLEDDERAPRNLVPELSRRARSIEVYAALASLGRSGVCELVERCCRHARRFASGLAGLGFEILNDVVLNVCVAAIGSDANVQAISDHVEASGEAWFTTTRWHGRLALRLCVASWATRDDDIERTLDAIATAKIAVTVSTNAKRPYGTY